MTSDLRRVLICIVTSAISGGLLHGQILNIDLGAMNGSPTGPGVIGAAGDQWNSVDGSNFNDLIDSGGATVTTHFFLEGVSGGAQGSFGYGDPGDALGQDYVFVHDNKGAEVADPNVDPPITAFEMLPDGTAVGAFRRFTIFTDGGFGVVETLDPAKTYDLHLLGHGDQPDQGSDFMLKQSDGAGGFTYSTMSNTGRAYDGTWVAGENYSFFPGVSPTEWGNGFEFELWLYTTDPDDIADDGIVNGSLADGNGAAFAALNGIQLIEQQTTGGLACDYVGGNNGCDIDDIASLYAGTDGAPTPLTDALISNWLTEASLPSNSLNGGKTWVVGDVDLDGDVDSTDLGRLLNNFGSTAGLGWGDGNLTEDSLVDSTDLGRLLNNFNFVSAAAVPEPSDFSQLLFALSALIVVRIRRS